MCMLYVYVMCLYVVVAVIDELLGVEQTATPRELKKAYHALALKVHPGMRQNEIESQHAQVVS